MPPFLATVLTITLVGLLFVWERRRFGPVSSALWIPVLWMGVTGSRFASQWLNLGNPLYSAAVTEGSPLDAAYFLALIILGLVVLVRRRLELAALVRQNGWLIALFVFSAVSVLWSDYPLIAAKRWIKTLGHPIMALIILTDPEPNRAFRAVMRRCAFLLLPFSVLMIKYYPQYGRGFDPWSGSAVNTGVGLTKNDLGYFCMLFGIFLVWDMLSKADGAVRSLRILDLAARGLLLGMVGWLLLMADSATSLATLVLGVMTLICVRLPFVNRRYIGTYIVAGLMLAIVLQVLFDPYTTIVKLLGRDPNLTDRTDVWDDVLAIQPNTLFGAGFESFWLGPRLELLWSKWWWRPTQAHNGYIETYLNLGIIGLTLLISLLVSTLRRIGRAFAVEPEFAGIRLAYLMAIVAFNYTEAAFKGVHLVWTVFHLIIVEYKTVATPDAPRRPKYRSTRVVHRMAWPTRAGEQEHEPRAHHRPRMR